MRPLSAEALAIFIKINPINVRYRAWYYGYCIVPTGTAVVHTHGYYGYYGTIGRVLRYYQRVLYSTHGYYVVPQTGYYRVLQVYAAEGMNRVRARILGLGLGFAPCSSIVPGTT